MVIHKVVMRREWRTGLGILGRMLARVVSHGMLAGQTIAVAAMVCVSSPSIHAWMTAMVYGPPACPEPGLVAHKTFPRSGGPTSELLSTLHGICSLMIEKN